MHDGDCNPPTDMPPPTPYHCIGATPSCQTTHPADAMAASMPYIVNLQKGLAGASISAWLWFRMYDPTDGAGIVGANYRTRLYWAIGNFSKFIRPGFVRIGAPLQPTPGVYVSAYKDYYLNNAGPLVIVAVNSTNVAKSLLFQNVNVNATPYITYSNGNLVPLSDTYLGWAQTIPAMSVVTFVANRPRLSADILFQDVTGKVMTWLSEVAASASYPGVWPADSQFSGSGDFDNDRLGDLVWRSLSTGAVTIWHNGGTANPSSVSTSGSRTSVWQIKGVGDFDGDGRSDILWYNTTDRRVQSWRSGSGSLTVDLGTAQPGWFIKGVGDFNGNGKSDILFRGYSDTYTAIWFDGNPLVNSWWALPDAGWNITGVGEFDQNGKNDIVWRHVSGTTAIWHDGTASGTYPGPLSVNWEMKAVGDFDGNGIADFLWRDTNNGALKVWQNGDPGWSTPLENPGGTWRVVGSGFMDK